jgi:hypothetical protein
MKQLYFIWWGWGKGFRRPFFVFNRWLCGSTDSWAISFGPLEIRHEKVI